MSYGLIFPPPLFLLWVSTQSIFNSHFSWYEGMGERREREDCITPSHVRKNTAMLLPQFSNIKSKKSPLRGKIHLNLTRRPYLRLYIFWLCAIRGWHFSSTVLPLSFFGRETTYQVPDIRRGLFCGLGGGANKKREERRRSHHHIRWGAKFIYGRKREK